MNGAETMELGNLVRAIEAREERKQDYIAPASRLEAVLAPGDQPRIVDRDGRLPMMNPSDVAHRQLASWSPIGTRYYDTLLTEAPDLWVDNVNHWLETSDAHRMLRTLKPRELPAYDPSLPDDWDGTPIKGPATLRAFVSDKFGRYEDVHLLRPVLERAQAHGWQIAHTALTDRRMHIRVTFPNLTAEVKVGDPVRLGAAFSNSEVGLGSWEFCAFVERLVCVNGMVVRDKAASFGRRHLTSRQAQGWLSASTLALEDRLLQAQVGDTLEAMTDGNRFARLVQQMKETTEQEIQHPTEAVRELARRASLTQDEAETVTREQIKTGDPTLWGLVNALTATARDLDSFERRAELETAAGQILGSSTYRRALVEASKESATNAN